MSRTCFRKTLLKPLTSQKSYFLFQVTLILLLCSTAVNSQVDKGNNALYTAFDRMIGEENLDLYNGPVFIRAYENTLDSHQYFKQKEFTSGHLVYKGQPYYDQKIKYNIFLEKVLITPKYKVSGLVVELLYENVDEFTISGHRFIRLKDLDPGYDAHGYWEVLEEHEQVKLLKKYTKKRNRTRGEEVVVIEYSLSTDYYLLIDGALKKMNSIGQWKREYAEQKKVINEVYKRLKGTYKTDKDTFFSILFNELTIVSAL